MIKWRNLIVVLILFCACNTKEKKFTKIQWERQFSKAIFEKAKKENKAVLLTLEANWCHWCHVMEDSTFSNPDVIDFLNEHFVCVAVDQDAHPELASRYRKYGWPATIILDADGNELLKKAGFMDPSEYLAELESALDVDSDENKNADTKAVPSKKDLQYRLAQNFDKYLNFENGGFKSAMKYIEEDSYSYALFCEANEKHKNWLNKSVYGAYNLCDPTWGGVYQYSTKSSWNHPHYEKLLHIQARYMRIFLEDYAYTKKEKSLQQAVQIKSYCDRFLKQKSGLYANAQDADLKKGKKATDYFSLSNQKRLKLGVPAIDTNTYTNSNADFARALLKIYSVKGNEQDLRDYQTILKALLQRKNAKGLYKHSYQTKTTDALRDNLAMAHLLIEHVKCFQKDEEIKNELARLMNKLVVSFKLPNGCFKGFTGDLGLNPAPVIEENIPLARIFNWYAGFSGQTKYKHYAQGILTYLQKCDAKESFFHEPGILMLIQELNSEAQSYLSVNENSKSSMLNKAYAYAPFYSYFKVFEKGKIKEYDELFSGISEASLFICTSTFCSSPIKNESEISAFFIK